MMLQLPIYLRAAQLPPPVCTNGRWLLAGGDVNFATSNSVIAWDPTSNTWNNLPNMVQARDYLAGATAGQSFYAVAGNSGPGTPTNDNQQYTNTYCDANNNLNATSNSDANTNCYTNGDSQCDSDSNTDAYANRNSKRYTEGYSNTPGSTHAIASPVGLTSNS
jgi:hypothetical protein